MATLEGKVLFVTGATGRFLIDEQVLRDEGVRDFAAYACAPGESLRRNLFLDA